MQYVAHLALEPIDFTLVLEAAQARFRDVFRGLQSPDHRAAYASRARDASVSLEKMARRAVHTHLERVGLQSEDVRARVITYVLRDGLELEDALAGHLPLPAHVGDCETLHHLLKVLCQQVAARTALGEVLVQAPAQALAQPA